MQTNDTTTPGAPFGPSEGNNREATSDIRNEGAELLSALFRDAPDDQLLEFRIIAQGGAVLEQQYHQIGELRTNGFDTAIPTNYDGRANVYYGVCPRIRRRGTRDDVELATAVWFDEITRAAPELPPFSWLVETSIGKVQGGYFLKEPSDDLDQIELICRRLASALGGDNVGDRARILRLPGFINCKYEGDQRAHLLEFRPGGVL